MRGPGEMKKFASKYAAAWCSQDFPSWYLLLASETSLAKLSVGSLKDVMHRGKG